MPICALCKEERNLRISHIVPAFVIRWLKQTSATGYLRFAGAPHKRAQDGLKMPLLCAKCEQTFSRWEREFANAVFHPLVENGRLRVEYGPWFLKYCVSISWRALTYEVRQNQIGHLTERQQRAALEALDVWSNFLQGKIEHPGRFEQRFVLLDALDETSMPLELPPNMNRYLLRGLELDIANTSQTAFTFVKAGPFALFGIIESDEKWRGTRVSPSDGFVGPQRYELPINILEYWIARAERHADFYGAIPENQRARFEDAILKDPTRFLESGTFRAMERDVQMFGSKAFRKEEP